MSDTMLFIVCGFFLLLFLLLIYKRQFKILLIAAGALAVFLGFHFYNQVPEKNLLTEIKMINDEYESTVELAQTTSYTLFLIGGLLILLGLIAVSKRK